MPLMIVSQVLAHTVLCAYVKSKEGGQAFIFAKGNSARGQSFRFGDPDLELLDCARFGIEVWIRCPRKALRRGLILPFVWTLLCRPRCGRSCGGVAP